MSKISKISSSARSALERRHKNVLESRVAKRDVLRACVDVSSIKVRIFNSFVWVIFSVCNDPACVASVCAFVISSVNFSVPNRKYNFFTCLTALPKVELHSRCDIYLFGLKSTEVALDSQSHSDDLRENDWTSCVSFDWRLRRIVVPNILLVQTMAREENGMWTVLNTDCFNHDGDKRYQTRQSWRQCLIGTYSMT